MIFPDNPKIVLLEDTPEDAAPLIQAFAKLTMPCVHYRGVHHDSLPPKPLKGVRLLFLDLHLGGTEATDDKTVISGAIGNLKRVLDPQNGPWTLIVWSLHPLFIARLKERLTAENYHPAQIISFNKAKLKDNPPALRKRLRQAKKEIGHIGDIIHWEMMCSKAAACTVNDLFHLSGGTPDQSIGEVLNALAAAALGKSATAANGIRKKREALKALSEILENEIRKHVDREIRLPLAQASRQKPVLVHEVNRKLLFDEPQKGVPQNGIYKLGQGRLKFPVGIHSHKHLPQDCKMFKDVANLMRKRANQVIVDLTPICDRAQEKYGWLRVCSGFLIPLDAAIKGSTPEYVFVSSLFSVPPDNKKRILVVDLRTATTLSLRAASRLKCVLTMRRQLAVSLQHDLAGHLSRPGMTDISDK